MKVILGFMPLLDCASLVVAAERGFAAEEDLELALVRETSWANIRDRVVVGHFDAAHMLGPMTVASTLGIGHVKVPVIAPFALGLGGNAITVSLRLWEQMTSEGASVESDPGAHAAALKRVVVSREKARREPLTFAMVYPFSCHNYELRYWLAAAGIDPDRELRLIVIPPPFLVDALRAGQIDGFCVGEPWNSVAVHAGVGTIVTSTTAIWPFSPCNARCIGRHNGANDQRIARSSQRCWRSLDTSVHPRSCFAWRSKVSSLRRPTRNPHISKISIFPRNTTQPSPGSVTPCGFTRKCCGGSRSNSLRITWLRSAPPIGRTCTAPLWHPSTPPYRSRTRRSSDSSTGRPSIPPNSLPSRPNPTALSRKLTAMITTAVTGLSRIDTIV
jgi:hypothetical protein